MWLMNHFFAPDLPTASRLQYIEACYMIARYEWLIRWAEEVEDNHENSYTCYPFSSHRGPEPVWITLHNARKTLVALMSEPDVCIALFTANYEITRLANELASWRGKDPPDSWTYSALHSLTDLSRYQE